MLLMRTARQRGRQRRLSSSCGLQLRQQRQMFARPCRLLLLLLAAVVSRCWLLPLSLLFLNSNSSTSFLLPKSLLLQYSHIDAFACVSVNHHHHHPLLHNSAEAAARAKRLKQTIPRLGASSSVSAAAAAVVASPVLASFSSSASAASPVLASAAASAAAAAKAPAIPYTSLQDCMLERNVTIRQVQWWGQQQQQRRRRRNSEPPPPLLLQIYQSSTKVAPVIANKKRTKQRIQKLMALLLLLNDDDDDSSNSSGTATTVDDVEVAVRQSELASLSRMTVSRLQKLADDHAKSNNTTATGAATAGIMQQQQQQRERKALEIKICAEQRAGRPVDDADADDDVHTLHNQNVQNQPPAAVVRILYLDDHICVVNKPSGILAVPGPRRNPSLCQAVYELLNMNGGGGGGDGGANGTSSICSDGTSKSATSTCATGNRNGRMIQHMDQMVVHRLDMDTSGILVFALSMQALTALHDDFRRHRVHKCYQALLCGHVVPHEVEIEADLERDPHRPPFMRIAQPRGRGVEHDNHHHHNNNGTVSTVDSTAAVSFKSKSQQFQKFLNVAPKPSLTEMRVKEWTYLRNATPGSNPDGHDTSMPVTRVELVPRTGRTHQLRVHAAALGHPIVGDDIYGYGGEGDCGRGVDGGLATTTALAADDVDDPLEVQRKIGDLQLPLCLHAYRLSLIHPVSRSHMVFECDPPF